MLSRYYAGGLGSAFEWLTSAHEEVRQLRSDVIDTLRALRCADALRQRGVVLRTSGNYELLVDQTNGLAICAFRTASGQTFLVTVPDPWAAGEANVAGSELGRDGNLRISFHRGAFADAETAQFAAHCAALVVNDIRLDVVESFRRDPSGQEGDNTVKNECEAEARDMLVLIEGVEDNPEFAHLVCAELGGMDPQLRDQVRVVPSLQSAPMEERDRYLAAEELDWDVDRRRDLLSRLSRSGHKTENVDPVAAFQYVKVITLSPGETLIEAGAPSGFVYIALEEGLTVIPLGGYQHAAMPAWVPLGNIGVIRGGPRNSTVVADRQVSLLMIPREVYLREWHRTYSVTELAQLITNYEL